MTAKMYKVFGNKKIQESGISASQYQKLKSAIEVQLDRPCVGKCAEQ